MFIDARKYYTVVDRTLNEWTEWQFYAAKPYGYHLFQSTSMDGPWKERTFSGPNVKDGTDRPGARHGCIVKVNETVYQALLKAYKK